MADREAPFLLTVIDAFTITGHGLVVAGTWHQGSVRTGDQVVVRHGGRDRLVTCRAVETFRAAEEPMRSALGLLLPELAPGEVVSGDTIRSPDDGPAPVERLEAGTSAGEYL